MEQHLLDVWNLLYTSLQKIATVNFNENHYILLSLLLDSLQTYLL